MVTTPVIEESVKEKMGGRCYARGQEDTIRWGAGGKKIWGAEGHKKKMWGRRTQKKDGGQEDTKDGGQEDTKRWGASGHEDVDIDHGFTVSLPSSAAWEHG